MVWSTTFECDMEPLTKEANAVTKSIYTRRSSIACDGRPSKVWHGAVWSRPHPFLKQTTYASYDTSIESASELVFPVQNLSIT
eukprot:4798964-Amphidinium_carterae.1